MSLRRQLVGSASHCRGRLPLLALVGVAACLLAAGATTAATVPGDVVNAVHGRVVG